MTEQPALTPKPRLAPGEVEPMPLSVFIPEKLEKAPGRIRRLLTKLALPHRARFQRT
jgi:hypothetical protein